jgi:hypothetical protein
LCKDCLSDVSTDKHNDDESLQQCTVSVEYASDTAKQQLAELESSSFEVDDSGQDYADVEWLSMFGF